MHWPKHPLFSAEDETTARAALNVFSDGLIALDGEGGVLSVSSEALRLLGFGIDDHVFGLSDLGAHIEGWDTVKAQVVAGKRRDLPLRGSDGQPLLATLVRLPGDSAIRWIFLRDVEAFEYRCNKTFQQRLPTQARFLSSERTRPDFATQRQLSETLNRLLNRGELAIRQGARILITGESGVGKSEIARYLHAAASNVHDAFVIVNCASSSGAQIDTALFGSGEETGGSTGLMRKAEGGTIFLDEVAELPLSIQAKLLGFLEDGAVRHWQGGAPRGRQVRVISATNRNLRQLVGEGAFRSDLHFRLAVINLRVPPLRDLTPLIEHLTDRFTKTINQRRQSPLVVPERIRELLNDYSFPGNIRELQNIIQRISLFIDDAEGMDELIADLLTPVVPSDITVPAEPSATATWNLRSEVRQYERGLIDRAIQVHGSKRKAAKALGVDIGTVVRKTAEPV